MGVRQTKFVLSRGGEPRDESTRRASNLYDLLYHPDEETRRAIARDIEKREGEGLLIFLDGYEDISNEQQSEFSVFQEILINQFLRKVKPQLWSPVDH